MEIYLDNSATTRTFPEVAELMSKIMCEDYGNPSSLHLKGVQAEKYLRYAKETLARIMKVSDKELIFTSGGTESDNLALIGVAMANYRAGKHLITTKIEHPAILQTMHYLEDQGFEVTYLSVGSDGCISLEELKEAMRKDTILVSIMHTNNEIGSVQPIEEAARIIKSMNPATLFHVDAVQGFGKFRIMPKRMGIDLLSVSGHKIHGPKGVGFLYVGEKVKIHNIIYGGGQQKNMRSGTENVPGIAGMARAAEILYTNLAEDTRKLYSLKKYLCDGLMKMEDVKLNNPAGEKGAPHIVSLSVKGIRSEVMLHALEDKGIFVSSGSACASNKPAVSGSATLRGIGLEKEYLDSTIRMSMSVYTTKEEIDYTLQTMYDMIPMLRKYTRH
ncbi:MAG: cysteine desulfurase family protein [Lachnospiraceae bacterium]